MKHRSSFPLSTFGLGLFGVLCLAPSGAMAQSQALYFDGRGYASFQPPAHMPLGGNPKTVELWLRAAAGNRNTRAPLLELGNQSAPGSALGLWVRYDADGRPTLFFRSDAQNEVRFGGPFLDEEWHFVALTYDGRSSPGQSRLLLYLDSEKVAEATLNLDTGRGTCYIGGIPQMSPFFRGAIDNLTIWSEARSPQQIRDDMQSYPPTSSADLTARFLFNEKARGRAFSDSSGSITGRLHNSAAWTTPIDAKPSLRSEGIWFVIQSWSDVMEDQSVPAAAWALRSIGQNLPLRRERIPLAKERRYDEFLWRLVYDRSLDRYRILNKATGEGFELVTGAPSPAVRRIGQNPAGWRIAEVDRGVFGTNVFRLTDSGASPRALTLSGDRAVLQATDLQNPSLQAWVFQPMALAIDRHIPGPGDTVSWREAFPRVLDLEYGFQLRATNTVTDWALLNAHNVYVNFFNAILNEGKGYIVDKQSDQRTITMISEYDQDPSGATVGHVEPPIKYPDVKESRCDWLNNFRGYGGGFGDVRTMITEELMWRQGVYARGFRDLPYSEFNQVIHEFGHTLNEGLFPEAQRQSLDQRGVLLTVDEHRSLDNGEWFPQYAERWFNSNTATNHPPSLSTREGMRTNEPDEFEAMATVFDERNRWVPPRKLREVARERPNRFAVSHTLIAKASKPIFSDSGRYRMVLRPDGRLVVESTTDGKVHWDATEELGIDAGKIEGALYLYGYLMFLNANDTRSLQPEIFDASQMQAIDDAWRGAVGAAHQEAALQKTPYEWTYARERALERAFPATWIQRKIHLATGPVVGLASQGSSRLEVSDELAAPQVVSCDATEHLWKWRKQPNIAAEGTNPKGAGRYGAVAFSIDDKGYVATGAKDGADTDELWEFDPNSIQKWTKKAPFRGGPRQYAVAFAINGKGYVGTGYAKGAATADFWEYDPTKVPAGEWTRKTDFPGTPRGNAVAFVINGKAYVGTGAPHHGRALGDFWEYDPTQDLPGGQPWRPVKGLNNGQSVRSAAIGFSVGDWGYVGTGTDGSLRNYENTFWRYVPDPGGNSDRWEGIAPFPGGGLIYGNGFGTATKGYAFEPTSGRFFEYDPDSEKWTERPGPPGGKPRNSAISFTINDGRNGKGYFGTGYDYTYVADFWEFTP